MRALLTGADIEEELDELDLQRDTRFRAEYPHGGPGELLEWGEDMGGHRWLLEGRTISNGRMTELYFKGERFKLRLR
jgi:hypothetical protein